MELEHKKITKLVCLLHLETLLQVALLPPQFDVTFICGVDW